MQFSSLRLEWGLKGVSIAGLYKLNSFLFVKYKYKFKTNFIRYTGFEAYEKVAIIFS